MENVSFTFTALSPNNDITVPDVVDKKTNRNWISWGDNNKLPNYLWDCYLKCSNLQAIVNNITNYIFGEGIETEYSLLSDDDETIEEVIQKCVLDYIIFGGFAVDGVGEACLEEEALYLGVELGTADTVERHVSAEGLLELHADNLAHQSVHVLAHP